jgi:Rrf2 family iron-sulfur cluster assembly transcriptional regulator
MRLTTKGKYAVTALLDLSLHQTAKDFISLSRIAERQAMPIFYLEQLFRNLRKSGIVQASRGPKGGYRLSRPSTEINISEVVASVEDTLDATQCGGTADCHSGARCLAHDLWSQLNNQVDNFLINKSLEDVIADKRSYFERKTKDVILIG